MNIIYSTIYLFLFCFGITLNAQQAPNQAESKIIEDLIQGAFDDLWAGMDSTKVLNYHTDDFVILEQGEVWDNDRIKAWMKKRLEKSERPKRINKMDYLSVEKHGNSLYAAYYNYAEFYQADSLVNTARWLESTIAIPTEDGYRLKSMHSTWAPEKK